MSTLVSTGQITIVDQNDVAFADLSSNSHTVPTNADGSNGNYSSCVTSINILVGAIDDTANWEISAVPSSGVLGSFVGNTYTVSGLTEDSGYVDFTATKFGVPSLTTRYNIAKAKQGTAGQSLTIVPSNQGFSFTDGVAFPSEQVISLTVLKKDVYGTVSWFAEDGATISTDPNESGSISLSGFMFGMGGAVTGEVAYIDVSQLVGRDQVVITATCDGVTATHTIVRLDNSTAVAGATRNVFRGNWAVDTAYGIGDTIIYDGYGWACVTQHVSSVSLTPPTYPVDSNAQWALAAVKGTDAKLAYLTASSYIFTVAADGTVTPASITLEAVGQAVIGVPTFNVGTGTATLTGTGTSRTLAATSLTTDQAKIDISWDGLTDSVTITKVKTGSDGITVVLSNEAHVLPSATDGTVSSYLNSGTTVEVYEGSTLLSASATATASAFRIGSITQAPAATITAGAVSYAGTTVTIAQHSAMVVGQDTVALIIPVTVYRANGTLVTIKKTQTLSKSKMGAAGATGSTGATGATGISGLNFSEAKSLFLDPSFQTSLNSVALYNNLANGNTIITREAKQTDSPFADSAYNLKISNIGTASPGLGGFINNFTGRASAVFVQRFIAKIPVGYSLMDASNAMGDGSTVTWLTSKNGTGKFEEYIVVRKCGATGSFSGSGHIYLNGTVGTPAAPVNWYLAYSAAYDFSAIGFGNVTGVLSNEAHTVPTDSAGNNGNFTGAATTMAVYNGATDDSANWTVAATPLAGVTGSLVGKTYTVTAMTVDTGYVDMVASRSGYSSVTKRFTLTKSKAGSAGSTGATGATGAQGPAVVITPNRAASFTATDGNLDGSQADIIYTAATSGITSPTYVWTFSGLQTDPTASTTNTQTITAAQFGTSKAATITCTVSGAYKDAETIVRLEKSTAAPNATSGSNLVRKSTFSDGSAGSWNANGVNATAHGGVGEITCVSRDTLETGNDFAVTPGETLFFASDIWTGVSSYPATVGVMVSNSAGVVIAFQGATALPAGRDWTRVTGNGVMPAGAVKATPWLQIDGPSGQTLSYVAFSKIYVGRQQEGANSTYVDFNGDIQGVTLGGGTSVSNTTLQNQFSGTNLAAGASFWSPDSISNPANLNDGNAAINSANYAEFGFGASFIQADLGSVKFIDENRTHWWAWDGRTYQYAIAISRDGVNWIWVKGSGSSSGTVGSYVASRSLINGYGANTSGVVRFPTIDSINDFARYIRIYANGNTSNAGNHIYEWQIWSGGMPPDPYIEDYNKTVAPGATKGATFGVDIDGKINPTNVTTFIDNGAINTAQIADLAVGSAKIADLAVTQAKIASLAVGSAQIADAAITTAKIGLAAITTAKIGSAQIGTLQLASNAVTVSNSSSGVNPSTTLYVPANESLTVVAIAACASAIISSGGAVYSEPYLSITIDGTTTSVYQGAGLLASGAAIFSPATSISARKIVSGGVSGKTITISSTQTQSISTTLVAFGNLR